jgi:hypothetical protein
LASRINNTLISNNIHKIIKMTVSQNIENSQIFHPRKSVSIIRTVAHFKHSCTTQTMKTKTVNYLKDILDKSNCKRDSDQGNL